MNGVEAMTESDAIVFVVDDNSPMRESLGNLIRSVGLRVDLFASAQEFMRIKRPNVPGCLVLDVGLPGLSGLDLQMRLAGAGMEIPIVFITGHPDIPMSVRAMKAGAVEFLTKPFRDQDLIEAIQQGIERDRVARRRAAKLTDANEALRKCLDSLASVPDVDDFLGQLIGAITRQLSASSSALFLRNGEPDSLTLKLAFHGGRIMTPPEANYPEKLGSLYLDDRLLGLLKQPVAIAHLLNNTMPIGDDHRSYLLGIGVKTLLIVPLIIARELIGGLTFRFTEQREFRPEEIEIARALAAQTSLAIQLTRLATTSKQSAVLEERNRLAGEIHDSLAQSFAAIVMQLSAAGEAIAAKKDDGVRYLDQAKDVAQFGLAEARRTALSLQPSILDRIGLTESLRMLVERSNVPGRLCCNFSANSSLTNDLPPETQEHLLRIAQEAISNAVRNAKPTAISVSLHRDRSHLELQIRDNGCGISIGKVLNQKGLGMTNMQKRAEKVGGSLDIRAGAGRGTSITLTLPIMYRAADKTMNSEMRILISDDHPVVRNGLMAILTEQKDIKVVGEATDGEEACELYDELLPDLLLLDLRMPKKNGLEVIRDLMTRTPKPRIIVMTTYEAAENIRLALTAGAKGYLLKGAEPAQLLDTVRRVFVGDSVLPPGVADKLLSSLVQPKLTKREMQVLRQLCAGSSNKEIAQKLCVSGSTVKFYNQSLFKKLGVAGRTGAIAIAVKSGLIRFV
jgi:DNA-binding NarL/FixJ family response regulator/signal transduction histidine kinase